MRRITVLILVLGLVLLIGIKWFTKSNQQPSSTGQEEVQEATSPTRCSKVALKELTEGPYYKSGSPEQRTIRKENTPTIPLVLEGFVFDANCEPIANAWIDFWQADGQGNYDNSGYALRGHQYTDANGKYKLTTVVPGLYPGRTQHIHFKIKASDSSKIVTSQLFLPDGTTNSNDSIFDSSLVINITENPEGIGKSATYNFVVNE